MRIEHMEGERGEKRSGHVGWKALTSFDRSILPERRLAGGRRQPP